MTKRATPMKLVVSPHTADDADGNLTEPATLYSLRPTGVHTPYAESLDSYAFRLAARHRVARSVLDELVQNAVGESATGFAKIGTVDAPTEAGRQYARALAQLTGVPEVAELGLHAYAGALSNYRALKPLRAWCSQCFRQSESEGGPVSWPLLWSLSTTEICLKHGTHLQTQCLKCGNRLSSARPWSGPLDVCPKCGCDLAGASSDQTGHAGHRARERAEFDGFDRLAVELSAELVSMAGRVVREKLPLKVDVGRVLERFSSLNGARDARAIGRHAQLQKSTMHDLRHGKGGANLPTLTRLAVVARLSLAGVVVPALWRVNPSDSTKLHLPRRAPRCLRDWVGVRAEVAGKVARQEGQSATGLAKQMQIDPRLFRLRMGELADQLKDQAKRHLQQRFEEQVAHFTLRILEQRSHLQRLGQRASCRRIATEIQLARDNKVFRTSWDRSLAISAQIEGGKYDLRAGCSPQDRAAA